MTCGATGNLECKFGPCTATAGGGVAKVKVYVAAGIFERELGSHTARDGGNVTVTSSAADTIECEIGSRTVSAGNGTAVASEATGDAECEFGSRTACSSGGAAVPASAAC